MKQSTGRRIAPLTRLGLVKNAPNLVNTRTAFLSLPPTERTHDHFLTVGHAIALEFINPANFAGKTLNKGPVKALQLLSSTRNAIFRPASKNASDKLPTHPRDLRLEYLHAPTEDAALNLPQLVEANGGMDVDTAKAWLDEIFERFLVRDKAERQKQAKASRTDTNLRAEESGSDSDSDSSDSDSDSDRYSSPQIRQSQRRPMRPRRRLPTPSPGPSDWQLTEAKLNGLQARMDKLERNGGDDQSDDDDGIIAIDGEPFEVKHEDEHGQRKRKRCHVSVDSESAAPRDLNRQAPADAVGEDWAGRIEALQGQVQAAEAAATAEKEARWAAEDEVARLNVEVARRNGEVARRDEEVARLNGEVARLKRELESRR